MPSDPYKSLSDRPDISPAAGAASSSPTTSVQNPTSPTENLKDDSEDLAIQASDVLETEADKRKNDVAAQVKSVSTVLSSAADEIDKKGNDLPGWITTGVRKVASSVEEFAGTLDGKSSTELLSEVKRFATQQPGVFLSACAAAGFAASRVLSADKSAGAAQ